MKRTEWEKQLLKNLKALPKTERERIAEYYREMYNDKLDAGFSPEEILREFGDPAQCAEKNIGGRNSAGRLSRNSAKAGKL